MSPKKNLYGLYLTAFFFDFCSCIFRKCLCCNIHFLCYFSAPKYFINTDLIRIDYYDVPFTGREALLHEVVRLLVELADIENPVGSGLFTHEPVFSIDQFPEKEEMSEPALLLPGPSPSAAVSCTTAVFVRSSPACAGTTIFCTFVGRHLHHLILYRRELISGP